MGDDDGEPDPPELRPKRSMKELWEAIRPVVDQDLPGAPTSPMFPVQDVATIAPEFIGGPSRDVAVAVPMTRNLFAFALLPPNVTKAEFLAGDSLDSATESEEGSPAWLDEPERERICSIAADFVNIHVRRIELGDAIETPSRYFPVGTVVVSELPVPNSRLRHARFRWAINNGKVVELNGARLPVGHLGPHETTTAVDLPGIVRGDQNGLAYLLAYVLDELDLQPATPVAAVGAIGLDTNSALPVADIGPYLEAAEMDGMHDLVLPSGNGKDDVTDRGVHYWPVRDANDAVFSVLTLLSGEIVTPALRR
jgi:hypothetical protein